MFPAVKKQKEAQRKKIPVVFLAPEKVPAQPQVPDGTARAAAIMDGRVSLGWSREQRKSWNLSLCISEKVNSLTATVGCI